MPAWAASSVIFMGLRWCASSDSSARPTSNDCTPAIRRGAGLSAMRGSASIRVGYDRSYGIRKAFTERETSVNEKTAENCGELRREADADRRHASALGGAVPAKAGDRRR